MPGMSVGDDPATTSLSDATDCLVSLIERHDLSDIVLVAHDWSGYPVTAAAHRVSKRIAKLVYWSAFVPLAGESMLDSIPPADREMLLSRAQEAGGHSILVPYERWRSNFVQTAPEAVQQLTYGLLRPQPLSHFSESLSAAEAAIPDLPLTYLTSAQDLSLPSGDEGWGETYAPRLGVEPVTFDACHAATFTAPADVAKQLLIAAQA